MKQLKFWSPLVLILIVAMGLRLPLLSGSFWLDEAAQALESARPLAQQFDIVADFQPPLIHLLIHFALYLGRAEWWLRLVAALIPGLVTIAVTYKLGEKLGNRITGVIASLLLATSSFHIFYSQELRPYSLPAMFAVLSWWMLIEATDVRERQQSIPKWIWFVVWSALGLYSSFLYPFLMIGQLVWLICAKRERVVSGILAMLMAGVCFVPWLPIFKLQLAAGGTVRQDLPGWSEVVSIPQFKSLPLVAGKFIFGVINLELNVFFVVALMASAVTATVVKFQWYRQSRNSKNFKPLLLTWIWFLVPLITAWIVSFWIPVVQPKRVLFLLPAFYLSLSLLITQVKNGRWRWLLASLLLGLNLIGTGAYYFDSRLQRENWRSAHQEILRKYPADRSVAVFVFTAPFAPWEWYDQTDYPTFSTNTLHIDQATDLQERLESLSDYHYIIVFDYLRDLTDPNDKILSEIEAFGYRGVELLEYPNIGFIRIYARPEAVMSYLPSHASRN